MKKLIVLFALATVAMACGGGDKPAEDPSTQTTTTGDPAPADPAGDPATPTDPAAPTGDPAAPTGEGDGTGN
jgi:hypothetical protein